MSQKHASLGHNLRQPENGDSSAFARILPLAELDRLQSKLILIWNLEKKPRITTHDDLDGIASASLMKEALMKKNQLIGRIRFISPSDIENGTIKITGIDILIDIPYSPHCGAWFDHHESNKPANWVKFEGYYKVAPSAARVIMEYFGPSLSHFEGLVKAVDKIDSGSLTVQDVKEGDPYQRLAITLRHGGTHNPAFKRMMVDLLRTESPENIMRIPKVALKYEQGLSELDAFSRNVVLHTNVINDVAVVDLRGTEAQNGLSSIPHTLFPDCLTFVRLSDSQNSQTEITVNYNQLLGNGPVDLGKMMEEYSGGGHFDKAGATVPSEKADEVVKKILISLRGK